MVRKNLTLFRRQCGALICSVGLPAIVITVGALLQALLIDQRQAKTLHESEIMREHLIDSCAKVRLAPLGAPQHGRAEGRAAARPPAYPAERAGPRRSLPPSLTTSALASRPLVTGDGAL